MYAIRLLENNIADHRKEIDRLENIEYETVSDGFFAEAEIKERKDYIWQLQWAILTLSQTATPIKKITTKRNLKKT